MTFTAFFTVGDDAACVSSGFLHSSCIGGMGKHISA